MRNKKIENGILFFGAVMIIILFNYFSSPHQSYGSTPGGLNVGTTTTTTTAIGSTTPVTIFNQSQNCSSRIITTAARDMRFFIGSSTVAGPIVNGAGTLQLSSTTVAYKSEDWGCGVWSAVSYETSSSNASTTITTVETH